MKDPMSEPVAAQTTAGARLVFLDNLRTLMVLLVVVLHVACAYSSYSTWWYVDDTNAAPFDFLLLIIDNFSMPVLFFLAGYFALPSLVRKRSGWSFAVGKLKRLGFPWCWVCSW